MVYRIFERYSKELTAFSTERVNYFNGDFEGVSLGNYGSLNLCHYVGDVCSKVNLNRNIFCNFHSINSNFLVIPTQTHSNNVKCIDNSFFLKSNDEQVCLINDTDALITDVKGACIGINTADCVPILIYDPIRGAGAAIHAGWRGAAAHIVENAISCMSKTYGSNPSDMICAIGPHISVDYYEVGDELKLYFAKAGFNIDDIFKYSDEWKKPHLNLSRIVLIELYKCGINPKNIECSDVCTFCHSDQYFSARKLGIKSGRIFSGLIIR